MLARGVAQMRLSGTMPSTSVQAELQMPSMITRSLRSRTFAYFALYCSTKPPKSRVTCRSAKAGLHHTNATIRHTIRIGRPQLPASCVARANIRLTAAELTPEPLEPPTWENLRQPGGGFGGSGDHWRRWRPRED